MYSENILKKETVAANQKSKEKEYWLDKLSGEWEKSRITYDYRSHAGEAGGADSQAARIARESVGFRIDGAVFSKVTTLCNNSDARLHMVLTAILTVLVDKYTGNGDIVIGTPIYRQKTEGEFINTEVAVRNRIETDMSFKELLLQVRQTLREAFENQDYPVRVLLKQLGMSSNGQGFPLFDIALLLKNIQSRDYLRHSDPKLVFLFSRTPHALEGEIEYHPGLYEKRTVRRLADHFTHLLETGISDMDLKISRVEMLTPGERKQLLVDFNNTSAPYPGDKTIHALFERQVERTPDAVAVMAPLLRTAPDGDELTFLTYGELNRGADVLAGVLRQNGVGVETVVGIKMARSIEMVIGLLAILKAGGAYLPIDPDSPPERVLYMLKDSGAKLLLTHSEGVTDIPFTTLRNFEANRDIKIVTTAPRGHIKAFDGLPVPDRSLIDLEKYRGKIGMASVPQCISMQATRGCPYECLFCHKVWSKKHAFRSAENIFSEVLHYYKKGVTNFAFIDDCFNLSRENSTRFYKLVIKNRLKIQIFFPNGLRGDLLTRDDIDLMVEAGTRGINLSLETASPRLQKLLKKNLDIPRFKEVMDYIAAAHPNVILEIATMHGFPTETEEEALMTLDFIKGIRWLHFPYIHILKVYPNTEMEAFALENGVSPRDIMASKDLAFHELPETLPFPKSFTRKYQADFMNNYFLSRERLEKVLPVQMDVLSEQALVEKYNTYLPVEIRSIDDIVSFAGLEDVSLPEPPTPERLTIPAAFRREAVRPGFENTAGKKILLLDLSQHFSSRQMLYNVVEQPLGLISLLTYLRREFGERINGRIFKAGVDFDGFDQLKERVEDFKPDIIGIRALTFYKEFFHETVSLLKQYASGIPIVAGGPYATSDYDTVLKDGNVRLVVMGEGEYTFAELIGEMLDNDFKIPGSQTLKNIPGIAFAENTHDTDGSCDVLFYDRLGHIVSGEQSPGPAPRVDSRNLAYVMYTSGSTGKPKGVMVEHRQVNNCIFWMQDKFRLNSKDVILQRTNLTFDPSVWEIFWPLYVGGSVRVLTLHQGKDAEYLIRLMEESERASMMYCPSTLVTAMTYILDKKREKPGLKLPWLIIGAEPVTPDVIEAFYSYYEGEIVNTYGPTECTINNTWYDLERGNGRSVVPIGKPVANNKIYILSETLQPMPLGKPGEICISGDSTARGYINDIHKTHKNFVENPFGEDRLYKTGDIGRWFEDGNIEIMGRKDGQVKIRGHRIELGEIENALAGVPDINDSVVIVRDNSESEKKIKRCKRCGITSRYPETAVNEDGLCDICENYSRYKKTLDAYFGTPADLEKLVKEANGDRPQKYDCLLLYSGGRGAAYALYRLVDMGLNVLAATYDNGYFGKADIRNIKKITASLGVDHVVLRHKNTDHILKESMKSASTVCRGCFHTSSSLAGEYAHKNNINVVVGATLSRGQIIENKLIMFLKQGITEINRLESEIAKLQAMGREIDKNMFDYIDIDVINDGSVFKTVKFADFYRYCDISNEEMLAYLNDRDDYWKTRKTYAVYSTNCPIKQLGDYGHLLERKFHYYGGATSWEKRLGHITLESLEQDLSYRVTHKGYKNFIKRIGYRWEKTPDAAEKYLCAYIVPGKQLDISHLREQLSRDLPAYMVPSYFVPLDKLPLTPSGKIDRDALPEPEIKAGADYVAPGNEIEKRLVRIWSEVLEIKEENISVEADFFDMGGNSIKIMRINSGINGEFGFEISFKDFLQLGKISQMAGYITENMDNEDRVIKYPTISADIENVHQPFPITDIQMAYLMGRSSQIELGGGSTHIYYEVRYNADIQRLNQCCDILIRRHPMLRAVIGDDGRQQILGDDLRYDIVTEDLRGQTVETQEERIDRERARMSHYIFDPSQWPLFDVKAFRLDDNMSHLCISFDPLIADAYSMVIITTELQELYLDPGTELPELEFTFRDYMIAHGEMKASNVYNRDKEYWLGQLDDFPSAPALPLRCNPSEIEAPHFKDLHKIFSREQWKQLKARARENNITAAALLCTAYAEVLAYWSNQPNLAVNLTVFNRFPFHKDVGKLVGDFTSLILLAIDLKPGTAFWERARRVQDVLFEGLEHRHYDGVEFIRELGKHRNLVKKAVMPIVFTCTLPDTDDDGSEAAGAGSQGDGQAETGTNIAQTSQVYLDNAIVEGDGYLRVNWFFVEDLFEPEVIGTMFRQYIDILTGIAEGSDHYEFQLRPADRSLLEKYNRTHEPIIPTTLQQLIEDQVLRTPDNIAVRYGVEQLTFRELDKKSNRVAAYLREQGVEPNDYVGVITPRGIDTIIHVTGVLKAGAAYVPIDPEYPEERRDYIFSNSGGKFLIETGSAAAPDVDGYPAEKIDIPTRPSDIAYIIYTSGSTGRPKGVVISHRAVTNTIIDIDQKFRVDENDRIMAISSMCFDLSVYDVFGAFSTGAVLELIPDQRDIESLVRTVQRQGITFWNSVPAIMNMAVSFIRDGDDGFTNRSLRAVLLSGDWIPLPLPGSIKRYFPRAEVVSLGGATEGSIWSIHYPVTEVKNTWNSIPYGYPLANQTFYVLNYQLEPCPVDIPGDLYIGGVGVAEGYKNDEEKTRNSYIPHPRLGRIYKTGDTGVFREEGYIEFLGRVDHQVKIRGYRIELGEIETQLLTRHDVKDAVVVVKEETGGEKYLCGYVVSDTPLESCVPGLREYLLEKLPEYMVPLYFLRLEKIPLTPNGKVDRKSLPEPELISEGTYAAPQDEIETRLVEIWSHALGNDQSAQPIGIDDNFFELGGDSLKAALMISKIHKTLHVKLPLQEIFRLQSIRELSLFIKGKTKETEETYELIPNAEKKEFYALSPGQRRIYILQQLDKQNTGYNMPAVKVLEGSWDKKRLESIFLKLIDRHESLRTSFEMEAGEPVQKIHESAAFEIEYVEAEREDLVEKMIGDFVRSFDLSRAPLLRVGMVRMDRGKYILIVDMHHIIADGVSHSLLIQDFMSLYEGRDLPELRLQYKDFSERLHSEAGKRAVKEQEAYWLDRFGGEVPVINLPTDYSRPVMQRFEGNTVHFSVGKKESLALEELALKQEASLFMVLLAVFNTLLAKISGSEDIVVGTGIEGRGHEDLRRIVGIFVNTLALRNAPRRSETFIAFLDELKKDTLEAFENQDYPFEDIVEKAAVTKDTSRNPLFDVMFQFNNFEMPDVKNSGLAVKNYNYTKDTSKFDLTLWGWNNAGGLDFAFEYSTTLFKTETVETFGRYFREIVSTVSADPGRQLREINRISTTAKEEILLRMNREVEAELKRMGAKSQILQHRLNAGAERFGNKIAVEYGDTVVTYSELDARANRIAARMAAEGISKGSFVGVLTGDRPALIYTALAVIKAGCVFVPLDPALPAGRLEVMIDAAGIEFVFLDKSDAHIVTGGVELLFIDEWLADTKHTGGDGPPDIQYRGTDPIYVYFTSGSTGTPRAILGKNSSLVHFIQWEIDTFGVNEGYRFSQLANPGFDAFLRDVFVPLCSGGVVCIPRGKEVQLSADNLLNWLENSGVNLVSFVPSLFRVLTSADLTGASLPELNVILFSGERVTSRDLSGWFDLFGERVRLVNLWGTSETTLAKTAHFIRESDLGRERIPVGKPIPGAAVLALDENLEICEPLVMGELYIYTPFRSFGYHNDDQSNRERFIPHPFLEDGDDAGTLIHKTGDFGRILLDGNIDLLGRNDRQVKIRGIRIELEEIENALLKNGAVEEAVVVKKEISDTNEMLCAYIAAGPRGGDEKSVLVPGIKDDLAGKLPDYMVPAEFIVIDKVPRTPTGKVDYNALAELDVEKETYTAPRDDVERKLAELWSGLLKMERVGTRDSFFVLGGNSLNVMTLISMIHRDFDVRIPLGDIFNNPTIEMQARILREAAETAAVEKYDTIESADEKPYYPLSSAQKRMYIVHQVNPESTSYNMPTVVALEGVLDVDKLVDAFKRLVRRHESLRTSFVVVGDEPVQKIHPDAEPDVEHYEASPEAAGGIIKNFIRPFDLNRPPLIRVGLVKTGNHEHILLLDMYHIISDGFSYIVLLNDLMAFYNNRELPPLKIQYKDFSEWQRRLFGSEKLKKQEAYWLERFSGQIPALDIPTDYPRPEVRDFDAGDLIRFTLDRALCGSVYTLVKETESTIFMVLLAAYNILLSKYSGRDDVVVGSPVTGRSHVDTHSIIGVFLNMLAMRNQPSRHKTFNEFLAEVKQNTLDAFENQDFQFEELIVKLGLQGDSGRNPLFDTEFSMNNIEMPRIEIPGLELKPYGTQVNFAKFDLYFLVMEMDDDTLAVNLRYSTELFEQSTIEKMIRHYIEILEQVTADPDILLTDIASHDLVETKASVYKEDGGDFDF